MEIIKKIWVVLVLSLLQGCGKSYPEDEWTFKDCDSQPVLIHPASKDIDGIIEKALVVDNGSGISVAVMQDGELVYSNAKGLVRPDKPMTTKTRLRIGSVSKVFTTMAAYNLYRTGKLNIDAPVSEFIPELPENLGTISSRQLVTHTSGIRHYDFSSFGEANNLDYYPTLSDALNLFINDPLLFDPGTGFKYSSFGINLLGVVIEHANNAVFGQSLDELVLTPMGLISTVPDYPDKKVQCRADFYTVLFGLLKINSIWRDNSDFYPSGGLLSTPEDMVKLVTHSLQNEPDDSLLLSENILGDGKSTGYTFGWQVKKDSEGNIIWLGHGGQTNGAYASLRYYPGYRLAIAGVANYNFWLTSKRASFFSSIRNELPRVLGVTSPD